MSTTLSTITTLANDRRRDTSANSVDMTADGLRAINGALQLWDEQHDWPWQITSTVINYNQGVDTYPVASELAYKALVDLRPRNTPERKTELYYVSNNKFDSDRIHTNRFALKNEDQKTYLRLKYSHGWNAVLNAAGDFDGNGTWVGATAISNVSDDSYEYFDMGSSIKFDYSGTSGTLTNSDMVAVDVSRYAQRSTIYFNVLLQDVDDFTSITLKAGSSASDYITGAITTDYLGNPLVAGWNKCKLVWDGTTTTVDGGGFDVTAFDYLQFTIAYSSNPSTIGNRIENIFISENIPMTLEFYSHFMATDVSTSTKVQGFPSDAAAGDLALWSGEWDFVNEAFINSVLEIILWMTGETQDRQISVDRITAFVEPLKSRLPSKRRYPQMNLVADINF